MSGEVVFTQSDFSGGLFEAASAGDFTNRQLAQAYGVVLDSEVSIRSQPAVQRVGQGFVGAAAMKDLRAFKGATRDWLLGLDVQGRVWFVAAPSEDATSATTAAVTWTLVASAPVDTSQRFLCQVVAGSDSASLKSAWLVNGLGSAANAFVLGENPAGTAIAVLQSWASRYPSSLLAADGSWYGNPNVMPHADLGVMWGDYLVLGRVRWYKDSASRSAALSAGNTKPYKNSIWVSATPAKVTGTDGKYQEFRIDQWHPLDVWGSVVDPSSELLDMRVTDAGLLLVHTNGATLLRGNPPGRDEKQQATFRPSKVTEIGGAPWSATAVGPRSTFWAEAGTTAWVNGRGSVWETNGADTGRLDQYLRLGEPAAAVAADHVCSVGPWLFMARAGHLYALRKYVKDAAWTELNPGEAGLTSMCALGFALYYITAGGVTRIPLTSDTERGRVFNAAANIIVASPTLSDPNSWDEKTWHQVGVILAPGVAGASGTLVSVEVLAGAARETPPSWTNTLNSAVTARAKVIVPAGIGPSQDASVRITFTGDLRLEGFYVEARGSHRAAK